jgi:large subunit ribosomal protein L4
VADLTLKTKNVAGKDAGSVILDAAVFGLEPNVPLMHQVVTAQLAARRAGTQSTKTRAEVRGGGRKPYAQKGTGNARQGSIRAPHFTGGGVALGPKPRDYSQKTPKKMIKLAMRSALSDRASEGKVLVVDSWNFDAPKTKLAKQALDALAVDGNVLVVIAHDDTNALMSFRNLANVQVMDAGELNAYDVLCSDWVVFTEASLPTGAEAVKPAPKKAASKKHAEVAPEKTAATAPKQKTAAAASKPEAADVEPASLVIDAGASDAPYGDGSHAPIADDAQPDGFPIKGNADSMLFHVPDSRFYNNTVAEVWFATEEAAVAAGFSKPASQQKADEAAAVEAEPAEAEQAEAEQAEAEQAEAEQEGEDA